MTLAEDVNLEEFVMAKDELSGADIKVRLDSLGAPGEMRSAVVDKSLVSLAVAGCVH